METELTRLFDALTESTGSAPPDGPASFINRRRRGYNRLGIEDLFGQWRKSISRIDDPSALLAGWNARALASNPGEPRARKRHGDQDDRWLPYRTRSLPHASQRVGPWTGNHADVEKRELDLSVIMDSIPIPAILATSSGGAQRLNPPAIDYFGSNPGEPIDSNIASAIHPEDLPQVMAAQAKARKTGSTYDIQARHRRADGVYRWMNLVGMPLRDTQGRILCWMQLHFDVDDRKRPEETLHAVERDLSAIINMIPALAWSARTDGSAEFFNRHYLDYIGLTSDQAINWGWTVAVHPDDASALIASWKSIVSSERPGETEARLRRFDGKYRWFLFRLKPLRNESETIIKWCGINIDIDDRKRAEEKLRRSDAFLAEGQRTSLTGSFSWLLDSTELTFSDELYRIFEFDLGSPVTLDRIADRVHPDDIPLLFDKRADARSTGADHDYEMRLLLPNGSIKHVHVVSHSTRGHGDRGEYIGAIQDVTQRRTSEETFGVLRSELARMAKINSLGALTASIAHEVNQPLSGVITNASTCLRMLAADPPNIDGALETARRTIRDGHRAADVITRVRSLFSKKTAATERVNLNDAAKDVIVLSQSVLKSSRVALKTEFADDLPLVIGDRVQLQQVILNLLLNASEAMSGVDDRPRQIVIRTENDEDDRVRLTVRDTGAGFGPDDISKLFEAFYTTKGGGMGVGLSISQSIIERHHGLLRAMPNDGPGATFWFSIPRVTHDDKHDITRVIS